MDTNGPKVIGLDVNDAAKLTGFGRSKLYDAIRDGSLPARKMGAKTIILYKDLEKFVESLPIAPIVGSRAKDGKAA